MKTIILTTLAFAIFCLGFLACNKSSDSGPNLQSCAANSPLIFQSGTSRVILPDAFTPNADGHNDVYRPITVDVDSVDFSMSIIQGGDAVIFQTHDMVSGWRGQTISGVNASPGRYEVDIKFRTQSGLIKDTCNFVTLLGTNTSITPNCVITNGNTYHLEDQIDPAQGFTRPTQEISCP